MMMRFVMTKYEEEGGGRKERFECRIDDDNDYSSGDGDIHPFRPVECLSRGSFLANLRVVI